LKPYLEEGTGMEIFASKVGILVECIGLYCVCSYCSSC